MNPHVSIALGTRNGLSPERLGLCIGTEWLGPTWLEPKWLRKKLGGSVIEIRPEPQAIDPRPD